MIKLAKNIQAFADGKGLILCMFGCLVATSSVTFAEKHTSIMNPEDIL